mgnify:CR=1 FL=1
MSKMSDMTEYHASAYRLPSGFEHCSKLKPVAEAATALDRVKAVVDVLYSPGGCPWDGKQTNKSLLKNLLEETYEYVARWRLTTVTTCARNWVMCCCNPCFRRGSANRILRTRSVLMEVRRSVGEQAHHSASACVCG